MKIYIKGFLRQSSLVFIAGTVATSASLAAPPGFVGVENGTFMLDGHEYRFAGANLWYGAILASEGEGGDRQRLEKELDMLQSLGIDNLRVLAGADGNRHIASHIEPKLHSAPGVYDTTLLEGLDYLLARLEERDMKAVIYLNNAWEWSGGFGVYLEWAGEGQAPIPLEEGYPQYMEFASRFVRNPKARELSLSHIRNIVGRTNSVTGRPYSESPAIMAWQIANEPRAFSEESKRDFSSWIHDCAIEIKHTDPNHLVSTGSEGSWGCENDIALWREIHAYPEVDYANIHIWPYNWQWVAPAHIDTEVEQAIANSRQYIASHSDIALQLGKPIVIEEFGYPRDGMAITPGSPTAGRDAYYDYILSLPASEEHPAVKGVNFWGWGGLATPRHRSWQSGDDYCGDPAQEDQGLNSVFSADASTLEIVKKHTSSLQHQ